ncbi:MAG: glycosyltransferase family 2 protein [Gemmobacter sp.]|uniref:glycosyltransferase family 2 protein n=1 Tax=Gemmobacter sp. TaxID=1898957 RepID=UPI00391DF266
MEDRPLISVIVPVFNEEDNVERCYRAVREVFARVADEYRLELFFSDNHSTDRTFELLAGLAARDPDVRVIRLARNFGFQRSVLTAFRNVSGDAAVQIDCDLQDPPELILEFLKLWRQGHDVVVGIRRKRQEAAVLQLARKGFYRLLRRISDDQMIDDAGDFRLVDRSVIERLREVRDARPYTRGLVSALSARQTGIPYDRSAREFGKSKFPVRRLFGFAMDGIVNHSLVPLRLATWIGMAAFLGAFLMILWYVGRYALGGADWPPGFATLAVLLLGSIGLNAMLIGILGEYVGRIYEEVRVRPLTIIETSLNLDRAPDTERARA